MKNLLLLTLCVATFMTSCTGTGKDKGQSSDTTEDTVTDSVVESEIIMPQPVYVRVRTNSSVMAHYWYEFNEPVRDPEDDDDMPFTAWHNEWTWQQLFRQNATKYTNLILEDGTTYKVKYKAEQIVNPDGDTISVGVLHSPNGSPDSGVFYDLVDKKIKDTEIWNGVIVTDDYLKSHKSLPLSKDTYRDWSTSKPLPADIVKQLEQKYGMKTHESRLLRVIDGRYTYGYLQFKGEWKDAPKNKNSSDPDMKHCLAVDVLSDGNTLYINEQIGYYCSETDFGWNVDDEGEYSGCALLAAFEGDDGLSLCFYHPAPESLTVGIFTTQEDRLVEKFISYYYCMVDEETPVWKKDIAQMQRMYIEANPSERSNVKFTEWTHICVDYITEWIWIRDGKNDLSGAIFTRKDGKFTLVTEVGKNRTPSRGTKNNIYYLRVGGSAGGPSQYYEIYAFRDGKQIEHFSYLEVQGKLESCSLNGQAISLEEGNNYIGNLPEFQEVVGYFSDIKPDN